MGPLEKGVLRSQSLLHGSHRDQSVKMKMRIIRIILHHSGDFHFEGPEKGFQAKRLLQGLFRTEITDRCGPAQHHRIGNSQGISGVACQEV